jgi:hypothetical protein
MIRLIVLIVQDCHLMGQLEALKKAMQTNSEKKLENKQETLDNALINVLRLA